MIDIPDTLKKRPTQDGFVVPYFAAKIGDRYDFRIVDPKVLRACAELGKCWVCGRARPAEATFVVGPMCGINRTSAEPPSHRECAEYSIQVCPFLAHPKRARDEEGMPDSKNVAGIMLAHNPGVSLLWTSRKWSWYFEHGGGGAGSGLLFDIGEPSCSVEWWAEKRPATRAEVDAAVGRGLPQLLDIAYAEGLDAVAEIERRVLALEALYPAE